MIDVRRGAPPRRLLRLVVGVPLAAAWAVAQHRRLETVLPHAGTRAKLAPPPRLAPYSAVRAVLVVLRMQRATCLERALVLQAWFAGFGIRRDVIIGVRRLGGIQAHAWVDGIEDGGTYRELHRIPA